MLISPELIAEHNLSQEEYGRILQILGREPNYVELGIFSAMWSEHCSYKSSRVHLKKLPTKGPRVSQGPGENAGIVDIGGRRREWEASCATSSRWERGPSPRSTRCGSGSFPRLA